MKTSLKSKLSKLLLGVTLGLGVAVGAAAGNRASAVKADTQTVTYKQTSTKAASKNSGTAPTGSSITFDNTYSTKEQLTKNNSMTYTLSGYAGCKITKLTMSMHSNKSAGTGQFSLKAGTTTLAAITTNTGFNQKAWYGSWTQDWVDVTPTMSNTSYVIKTGENVVLTISASANSLFCQSFTLEYEEPVSNCTVSFSLQGHGTTTPNSQEIAIGGKVTKPTDPKANGYKFIGWYKEQGCTNKWNFDSDTVSGATMTLYAKWEAKTSVALTADDLDLDLQNHAGGVEPLNSNQTGVTYTVDDTSVATYSGGKFYPQAVGETLVTMTKGEDDDNVYEDGMFVITVTSSLSSYAVTWTNTNASVTGSDVIYDGEQETYTITAASGYKLPDTVSVSGATGSYSKTAFNTATLTIREATGPVSFSVEGIALANYGITFSGENYTHIGSETIQELGQVEITLTAAEHYDLPADVNVDGATKESYTKSTGKLVISNPTGAVTVTVDPVARERYTITVTGAGDSAEFFTYSGDTKIYKTETATVTIAPDAKGTDDIYVIRASDISVSGATKGTYNTTTHALTISNPTGVVTITVTPVKKVLNSIAVTTQPTKTSYNSGDTLNTAGLVVTATYTSGTETVPLSELKFSQSKLAVVGTTGTAKRETIYVYYGGKAASFTVNVTPVKTGTSGWNLVSATSELANNDTVIIAAKDYNYAISTTQNSNNRGQASITKSSDGKTATLGDGVQEITLVKNDDNTYSFKCGTSGYLYAASSSSNYMKTQSSIDGNAKWTISISSNTATITAQGSNTRNVMQYNQNSTLFSAYGSASQKALCIYKNTVADPKTGVAIDASYPAGDYTAEETINVSNISATLVYNDGSSTSVTSGLSINPSTYVEGTHEYTVSYSTYSTVIQIANVKPAKQMVGIELNTDNVTKAFVVDSTFEHDGLVVYGVYDNGDKEKITAGYNVSSPDMSTAGTKTITVTYKNFEAQTYDIEVSDSAIMNIVQGAVIEGYEGETRALEVELLNFTGTASWSLNPTSSEYYSLSNVSQSSTGYSATVTLLKACEEIELEISEANSGAESVTVTITVHADELTGITASTSKSTFVDGQTFDVSTVSVTAHYSSPAHEDEPIDIGDCTITAKDSRDQAFNLGNPFEIDTYTITVSYGGKSDSFTVTSSMPQTYLCVMTEIPGDSEWVKVSAADGITDGVYQFVYETDGKARFFNNADESSDYVEKNIPSSGKIADSSDIFTVTISSMNGGYSLKCTNGAFDGQYICGKSGSNTITTSATAVAVSISFNDDGTVTALHDSTSFRFNSADGNTNNRFRFYKTTTTGDSYHYPYLYKKVSGESDKSYNLVAVNENVYRFLKEANKFKCDNSGDSFDSESWTALNTTYASLLPAEKKQLQDAVVSYGSMTSDALYTNFIEKYEYIIWKYGNAYNFLGKDIPTSDPSIIAASAMFKNMLGNLGLDVMFNEENAPTSWVLLVTIAVAGLATGGYFYIRKRKED